MSPDIVNRLREYDPFDPIGPLAEEAAAEIEKLRALLYRVVNHGDATGDVELIADIKAATPEAGWT